MSRQMIGKPIATADNSASSPGVTQKATFGENCFLLGTHAMVINYGSPNYTGIQMKVYANRGGSAGKLLATSTNTVLKTSILSSEAHGYAEIFFTFDKIPLVADDYYHFSLYLTGSYTGDSTSHIAWKTGYPDPVHKTGLTINLAKSGKYPLELVFITSK